MQMSENITNIEANISLVFSMCIISFVFFKRKEIHANQKKDKVSIMFAF